MRELKFRVWGVGASETICALSTTVGDGGKCALTVLEPSTGVIFEQYTGLKDMNGRGIYEGDILQAEKTHVREFRRVAGFRHGQFGFDGKYDATLWFPLSGPGSVGKWFVIGNIHENPELLEGPR
mgnify:CR=1 FL=1